MRLFVELGMLQLVLDTSVVLKWILQDEKDAKIANSLRKFHVNEQLKIVIPNHALIEIAKNQEI